jgi:hypothetical protein
MHRFALRTSIVIASLSAAVLAVGAQSAGIFIGDAGLPAIDAGVSNRTRGPIGPRTIRKVSDVSTGRGDAVAPASVQPGRVLVRFRADAPASARMQAVRAISPRAVIAPRTPYADFDVVLVDQSQNPETVAAMLKTRHAEAIVEAQAEYRVHTMLVPNDPLYRSNQWNLQYLDLERGWDIQPDAGSDITVAILDTGVAYRAATIVATIPAFVDGSVLYPALGTVTIPYAAADQLVDAAHQNRFVRPF